MDIDIANDKLYIRCRDKSVKSSPNPMIWDFWIALFLSKQYPETERMGFGLFALFVLEGEDDYGNDEL